MTGKNSSILPHTAEQKAARDKKRLAKRYSDPQFRQDVQTMRKWIGSGKSLGETRDNIGVKSDEVWKDMVTCLAQSFAHPENILLEWQVRQNTRYQMCAQLMQWAMETTEKHDRFRKLSDAIIISAKIDQNTIELQKALGFLKVTPLDGGGFGISSEEVEIAEQRFNAAIQQRIEDKLRVKSETQSAVTVDVFSRSESRGETDTVGPTTLDQNLINGPTS